MPIPDPLAKKVTIPVKIKNGTVQFFYGGPLPEINGETIGDLIISAYAIKDKTFLKSLSEEKTREILPAGTLLLAQLFVSQNDKLDEKSMQYLKQTTRIYMAGQNIISSGYFAAISTLEPLSMILRGTKKSVLCSCKCHLPFLKTDATSINHAYTLLSTYFEKSRRSHSGNVFQKIFYENQNNRWCPLDRLRENFEAEEEDNRYIKKQENL